MLKKTIFQMNVLDGKTGLPLLDHPVIDSVGSQMGGLSVSVEGQGNDWLLYWTANCAGHEGSKTPFSFAKGSLPHLLFSHISNVVSIKIPSFTSFRGCLVTSRLVITNFMFFQVVTL